MGRFDCFRARWRFLKPDLSRVTGWAKPVGPLGWAGRAKGAHGMSRAGKRAVAEMCQEVLINNRERNSLHIPPRGCLFIYFFRVSYPVVTAHQELPLPLPTGHSCCWPGPGKVTKFIDHPLAHEWTHTRPRDRGPTHTKLLHSTEEPTGNFTRRSFPSASLIPSIRSSEQQLRRRLNPSRQ